MEHVVQSKICNKAHTSKYILHFKEEPDEPAMDVFVCEDCIDQEKFVKMANVTTKEVIQWQKNLQKSLHSDQYFGIDHSDLQ